MSKPWVILGKLADRKFHEARSQIQAIDRALSNLADRETRFEGLIQENLARLNDPSGRVMADLQVIGGFIRNLSFVVSGIKDERERLLQKRVHAVAAYQNAEREVKKMESLQEREEEKARTLVNQQEMREMDRTAIQRFNLKEN